MNWRMKDRYHQTSEPAGYTIAVYFSASSRDLVAWKGKAELAHRNVITTKEQYDAAMAELKQICERDAA
jgi:hypothetical protein